MFSLIFSRVCTFFVLDKMCILIYTIIDYYRVSFLKEVSALTIFILSQNPIFVDYIRHELPECKGVFSAASAIPTDALCIVDADTVSEPYPSCPCLIITRKALQTNLPCLFHPLLPGEVRRLLTKPSEDRPTLSKNGLANGAGHLICGSYSIRLTAPEYALCEALLPTMESEQPLSRKLLCQVLCNADTQAKEPDALLTVYMYRLRKKLAPLQISLMTHHKSGYLLRAAKGGTVLC